jgi:hypothetical protein
MARHLFERHGSATLPIGLREVNVTCDLTLCLIVTLPQSANA